jgi:hypothetical protein
LIDNDPSKNPRNSSGLNPRNTAMLGRVGRSSVTKSGNLLSGQINDRISGSNSTTLVKDITN